MTPRAVIDLLGWCLFKQVANASDIYAQIKDLHNGGEPRSINDLSNALPSLLPRLWGYDGLRKAVHSCVHGQPHFLQSSDVLLNYDAPGWHRDTPFRKGRQVTQQEFDWSKTDGRYDVVKTIFFASISHYAFAVVSGSHLALVERRAIDPMEPQGRFITSVEQALAMHEKRPGFHVLYIVPEPGDLFVFDQRLYHCGRTFLANGYEMMRAPKATIAACFGGATLHSERFHNYWRYERTDLKYRDMPEAFFQSLDKFGYAKPSYYRTNIFDRTAGLRDEVYFKPATESGMM